MVSCHKQGRYIVMLVVTLLTTSLRIKSGFLGMDFLFGGGQGRLPKPFQCGPAWAMVAAWEQGGLLAWLPGTGEDVAILGQCPINGPMSSHPPPSLQAHRGAPHSRHRLLLGPS